MNNFLVAIDDSLENVAASLANDGIAATPYTSSDTGFVEVVLEPHQFFDSTLDHDKIDSVVTVEAAK